MQEKISKQGVKHITQHIFELPTLPTTVARMIEVIDHPHASAETLNNIIAGDQALAAQVLKLANSAYYGFPRRINTITLAIVVIGFDTLKNFGLSASVIDRYAKFQNDLPFDIYLFWEHAICTAIASKMLAKETHYQVSGEAFAAGLLHDLGKYVISLYFRSLFDRVVVNMMDDDTPMFKVEEQVLAGSNHAEIGSWLVEKWNLSEAIIEAIRCHHRPWKARAHRELSWIVHFADYLTKKLGVGFSGDLSSNHLDDRVVNVLKLRRNDDGHLDEDHYFHRLCEELHQHAILFDLIREKNRTERETEETETMRSGYGIGHG